MMILGRRRRRRLLFARYQGALATRGSVPFTLVTAGDSLTDMDAANIEGIGWVPRLARKIRTDNGEPVSFYDIGGEMAGWDASPTATPGIHVVNLGTSGRTSYNYIGNSTSRNYINLVAACPDLVAHMIGVNNYSFTSWTPVDVAGDIASRIDAIDASLIAAGADIPVHIVMVEPRRTTPVEGKDPAWWDQYGVELRRIVAARPLKAVLIDVDGAFGDTEGLRGGDGIHLTADGYELVASTVYAALT